MGAVGLVVVLVKRRRVDSKEEGMFSVRGMLVGLALASLPMAPVSQGEHGRRVLGDEGTTASGTISVST
jgi:hypothetical protein